MTASLPVLPALVDGTVIHVRQVPMRREFRHAAYQWLVDLDHLPRLPWWLRPLASFRSGDHLGDPDRPIKDNVTLFLATRGVDVSGGRILMLANARVLGHVFDPLSAFWCFDAGGELVCVVAEVHNTYGERHAYLLRPDEQGRAITDKQLYVSPFFEVAGGYELRFRLALDVVGTDVVLRRDEQVAFTASFRGTPQPASSQALLRLAARRPLMPQRISLLIRWHGIRLWARGLPVVARVKHHHQEGVR
jgi:DUF1365 family protein